MKIENDFYLFSQYGILDPRAPHKMLGFVGVMTLLIVTLAIRFLTGWNTSLELSQALWFGILISIAPWGAMMHYHDRLKGDYLRKPENWDSNAWCDRCDRTLDPALYWSIYIMALLLTFL